MTPLRETPANRKTIFQLKQVLSEILAEPLQLGFYETAEVKLKIHDGTIHEIRRILERVDDETNARCARNCNRIARRYNALRHNCFRAVRQVRPANFGAKNRGAESIRVY